MTSLFTNLSNLKLKYICTLVVLLCLGVGNAWGANVTLTLSDNSTDTWTNQGASGGGTAIAMYDKSVTGITLSGTSGYCNTGSSYTQIYASSTTTIASTVGKITKIVFNGKYKSTSGSFTDENSSSQAFGSSFGNKTFTYASGVSSMGFTASKQIYLKTATVYYATATTSKTSITGLDYTAGSGPSTAQSFTVSGTDLGGTLTVSAPTNFEVSKTSSTSGFANSVTLTPSSGTVSSTTIYVRLASGKSAGTYGGASTYVTVTGGGIVTKNVSVSGTVSAAASCDAPNAPTNSSVSGTGVTISTSSSSANYDIYYSTNSTTPTTQDPTATISSGNSKAITGLSYGTTYYYWMRKNCGGGSTSSWVAGASPGYFTTTVPAPTGVSAGSLSMTGATISITDANNVNSYDVYCSESSTAPVAGTTPSASGTSKSIAVTGLTAGREYYFWARAKGPNAKSDWVGGSTFTTLTLSSISVSTAPTKTKYLVGDNLDPTGLVITRTYSNSTSDTYTYAGHTAEFSFSPSSSLTAGTSKAITITYGGETTTTNVDVYSVTVNKVNISGTAISAAGVTASCSGRTLSQSVGSTNYKFNTYAVTAGGVGISGSTITGTPTGNVTINAKFHDPITVTWKVGSGAASGGTGEVKYGTAITALPSTPADNALASCGTNKFMGWSKNELTGTGNSAPADLFTTTGGATALTENTTYRAVFANQTSGGVTNKKITLTYSDFPSAYSSTESTFDKSDYTFGYGNYRYNSDNGTPTGWCKGQVIQARNKSGEVNGFYNKTEMDVTSVVVYKASPTSNSWTVYQGASSKPTSTTITPSVGDASSISATAYSSGTKTCSGTVDGATETPSTYTITGDNKYFNIVPSGAVYFTKIEINYTEGGGVTNSDYQTGCCSDPGTALSITSANSVATGGTVSLTSTGGNGGTVTWSVVNGTGSATISDGVLTAGSVGTVTVKAHQNANTVLGVEYCAQDAEQAFTVVSSTVNVTGVEVSPTSKAIVPGETFTITPTISPSNATDKSVSWSSSASDKASVSSGTVTGVAAGSATITCTTTDGSYTDETAVTVYAVTMQALDEDGNAIAVGGPGTPSRTGASISPAADAGNYVFKEWAISGASLGSSASTKSNTITNPTGAVTVTAKYYKPRTVKWSVNGNDSYTAGGATTAVAYNGTITTVPSDPSGLACAGTFVAWTDATHNNGQTAKDDDSYYEDALYTDAGDFPNITAATTTFYAVFAEGGEAAVNTTMWSENWTGVTSSKKPSEYDGTGRAVYNSGTVTYAESGSNCNVKAETYAGGSSPELYIKGGEWWNIAYIPTGGAATLTLTYMSNNDADVTTTTKNVAVGTTSSSGNSRSRTITISGDVSYFDLKFAKSSNTRVDNVLLKVASVSLTNYVTECDPNIVKVTYNANSGTTSCTNTTTDKTEDFTICSSAPTRDYYTFAGWLCSADSKTYAASATIPAAAIDADFTLTAQWTPVSYSITYNYNGGSAQVSPTPATSFTVESSDITLQTPTKGHDRFDGWYENADLSTGGVKTTIAAGSHENKTYYAKWTARHEIVFDYTGSASSGTTTIYRAEDENMEDVVAGQGSVPSDPSAPTDCSSKVFVGWSESTIEDETNDAPADLMKPAAGTVSGNKYYYAVWATQSSKSGPVPVFEDALCPTGTDEVTSRAGWDSFNKTYANSGDGVRVSTADLGGYMQLPSNLSGLAAVDTIKFKIKSYGDTNGGKITLSSYSGAGTYDNATSATFTTTNTTSWEEKTCILRNADNTTDISFEGEGSKYRIFIKDIKITKAGTIYTYSAYATSCCATKIDAPDVTVTKVHTATNKATLTLSWDEVTDATGYKVKWGDGEWEDNGTTRTYEKTNLANGTYSWSVKAEYDEDDYCGAEKATGSTTVNTAYEVAYDANTTGYTGDEPDGGFYESGETVTISATELSKSRYHFDGWTPYNTSTSAAISVTTGTFTMPAADVLIQGGWTEVLSGDEVYITSSKDITTMSSMDIIVERTTYKSGTMTISNQTGGQGGTFHAVITGATADASDGLLATVKIEYTPTKASVTESATMTAVIGSESYDFTVYGRSLPADFVIVAKVGAAWTALPADATSAGLQQGYSLTLDNTTTPTKATLAPSSAIFNYYAKSAKTTDYIRLAGKDNSKALWGNATNNIKMNAAIGGGYATGDAYEWKLATTDNATYTLYNDNSSRYLGVNSDKKWGTHAVAKTETKVLYFLPVDATADHIGMTVTSWGDNMFTFTTSDAIPSHDHVAVECNGDSYAASMTGSGPYTITISSLMDFEDYSGASLVVQWRDAENAVLAQGAVLLPIFITGDNTDFEGYDPDILSATDIHITNGSTLTITGNFSVHDLSIEGGSTLNISKTAGDAGVTFGMNSLYLRGGWNETYSSYDVPRVYIDPKSTLTKTVTTVNYDISVNQYNYYPFAVPFRVRVKDIDYANSTLAYYSEYGPTGQYVIKEYDGARRAEVGPDQQNNWKVVPQEDKEGNDVYLEPGRGYILTAVSLPSYGGGVIRFPLSFTNAWTAKGEQGTIDMSYYKNVVSVEAYAKAEGETKNANKGWNLLGVPFMSCYATGADMGTDGVVMQGKFDFKTGEWKEEDVRYVNVPVHDFSEYIQVDMEDDDPVTVLRPGWCFFVQIEEDGNLTFQTADQAASSSLPIYAPKREQENMPTVKTGIILSDGEKSDKTTFLISDKYSAADYEINADLEKMFGSGYTLATYSISGATRLAYNALSNTDASNVIPIGYRAPANGEYTFSINPRYAESEAFEHVNLIDYETGIVTDLLMYSYTFSTDSTQNDSRFALNVVPRQETPTDLEDVQGDDVQGTKVRKMIINDQLFIIRDGQMYDATGRMVK